MDNVPAAAKNTERRRAAHVQRRERGRASRSDAQFKKMTFRIRGVTGFAVPASARHEPAGRRCRSRPTPTAIRCRICGPTRRDQSELRAAPIAFRRTPTCASRARRVGTTCRQRELYTGTDIDGCPDHLPVGQRPEVSSASTSPRGRTCGSTAIRSSSRSKGSTLVAGVK